ncbi:MAG: hypothetical protein R2715_03915 [Ilumatobacteraceae bacterium]
MSTAPWPGPSTSGDGSQIDGYVLDLVIDFVTCVVVPAAFLHEFGLLPGGSAAVALVGLIVFTSALWFSRTDMMTEDHWFRGFPATWNLVAPTLYLVGAGPVVSTVVVIGFSVCSLTNIRFRIRSRSSIAGRSRCRSPWCGSPC